MTTSVTSSTSARGRLRLSPAAGPTDSQLPPRPFHIGFRGCRLGGWPWRACPQHFDQVRQPSSQGDPELLLTTDGGVRQQSRDAFALQAGGLEAHRGRWLTPEHGQAWFGVVEEFQVGDQRFPPTPSRCSHQARRRISGSASSLQVRDLIEGPQFRVSASTVPASRAILEWGDLTRASRSGTSAWEAWPISGLSPTFCRAGSVACTRPRTSARSMAEPDSASPTYARACLVGVGAERMRSRWACVGSWPSSCHRRRAHSRTGGKGRPTSPGISLPLRPRAPESQH